MTLTVSNYATTADLQNYLQASIATDQANIWPPLLNAISRFIDEKCGQYFYNAGTATRYFDGDGGRHLDTGMHPFFNVTSVQQAHFENEPVSTWITVTGDGVTPGSTNWWYFPANPRLIGSTSSNTATRPYYGIDLAIIPAPNTTYLPNFVPGYRTVAITASWGWPVVPDDIKHMTLKMAARIWNQYQASWNDVKGVADIGMVDISKHFDMQDEYMLVGSGYVMWSQGA